MVQSRGSYRFIVHRSNTRVCHRPLVYLDTSATRAPCFKCLTHSLSWHDTGEQNISWMMGSEGAERKRCLRIHSERPVRGDSWCNSTAQCGRLTGVKSSACACMSVPQAGLQRSTLLTLWTAQAGTLVRRLLFTDHWFRSRSMMI